MLVYSNLYEFSCETGNSTNVNLDSVPEMNQY